MRVRLKTILRRAEEYERRARLSYPEKLTAEFVGTIVVTLGTIAPAAVVRVLHVPLGYAVQMSCTGLATTIVIYALGRVSAHTNPCTTLAFVLRRSSSWQHFPGYVAAQFAGALAAGGIVVAILHPPREALLPQLGLGPWVAFWIEIVMTAIVILVAVCTADEARFIGPETAIANGGATIFARLLSGSLSGGSMNPARTLGPAIVAGGFSAWWVYATAPVIGTVAGVVLVHLTHGAFTAEEEQALATERLHGAHAQPRQEGARPG